MMKWMMSAALLALAACAEPPQQPSELGGRWEVQQVAGASLGDGIYLWLEINPATRVVSGFTGCNAFNSSITELGAGLSFAPVAEEAGECPSEAAATDEARFLGVLPSVTRYVRNGRSLELLPREEGAEALVRLRLADEAGG